MHQVELPVELLKLESVRITGARTILGSIATKEIEEVMNKGNGAAKEATALDISATKKPKAASRKTVITTLQATKK